MPRWCGSKKDDSRKVHAFNDAIPRGCADASLGMIAPTKLPTRFRDCLESSLVCLTPAETDG